MNQITLRPAIGALLLVALLSLDSAAQPATQPSPSEQPIATPSTILASVPEHFRPKAAEHGSIESASNWIDGRYRGKKVKIEGVVDRPQVRPSDGSNVVELTIYTVRPERWGSLRAGATTTIFLKVDDAEGARFAKVRAGTAISAELQVTRCGLTLATKERPKESRPRDVDVFFQADPVRVDIKH